MTNEDLNFPINWHAFLHANEILMPFTISLNLNVTVKIFEIHVHRLLNNVASFFISFRNVKASRIEMQGSKARGSKYMARRLEARGLEARRL